MNRVKESLLRKKTLYTICFIFLGMIDFVRHTQQESWWGPIVNCTGILLMVIVLSKYKPKDLLCRFSWVWTGISVIMLISVVLWRDEHIFGIYRWTAFTAVLNIWLIGILAYRTMKNVFVEKSVQIKWNAVIIFAIAMVFFMMLSPYHAVWPLWFLSIFGLFYLTHFNKADFGDLREAMADGTIVVFLILQIYAYGYRPFDVDRYMGAFSNSNMTALHYLVTYTAVLFKLHFLTVKEGTKKWKMVFFVLAAGLLDFQLLTMTRTAWIVSAVITVLFGLLVVRRLWKKNRKAVLGRGIALGLCTLLLFPGVFATVRWLPAMWHHPVWYAGEWAEYKVHSFDPADSEKYTDFDEFMAGILKRLGIAGIIHNPLVLKAQAAGNAEYQKVPLSGPENLTTSLRIRFTIYKAYLNELNWTGHGKQEGHYIITDTKPKLHTFVWHPQNVWIQVAYYYGIPAGILFFLLSVLILRKQIDIIAKNREDKYAFIPLFISIIFMMYGFTELVWTIGQFILFLFLFVQHPQFGMAGEEK